jgi:small subunit ribosomal protein S18
MACYFCQHNTKEIDYKDIDLLRRFVSSSAKIKSKERSGSCSKHQRQVKNAVKRARHMGLLPNSRK